MQLTVVCSDDRLLNIEVDSEELVENVKAICEAETGWPSAQQVLLFNGRQLMDGELLKGVGIAAGDMLMLTTQQPAGGNPGLAGPAARQPQPQQAPAHQRMNADGSAADPIAMMQSLRADRATMGQLRINNTDLARIIEDSNVTAFQEALRAMHRQKLEHAAEMARQEALLEADPFDPEAQRKIEELINQKNIQENYEAALENSPEVFGSVIMLYVNIEINGVPVKTFVDSGAQMTIMTEDFALKCHLGHLIDKRFQGMAVGVGSSKIIGRIHQVPMKVAGHVITSSITVLEQKTGPQFIFGLDMLKRHQCCIDLHAGSLRFPNAEAELAFLPDHEIPKNAFEAIEETTPEQAERNMANTIDGPSTSAAATSTSPAAKAAEAAAARAATAAGGAAPTPSATTPPAPSPNLPSAAAASGGVEEKLQKLIGLGFDRAQATQALDMAGGNEDAAASILFGDSMGFD